MNYFFVRSQKLKKLEKRRYMFNITIYTRSYMNFTDEMTKNKTKKKLIKLIPAHMGILL